MNAYQPTYIHTWRTYLPASLRTYKNIPTKVVYLFNLINLMYLIYLLSYLPAHLHNYSYLMKHNNERIWYMILIYDDYIYTCNFLTTLWMMMVMMMMMDDGCSMIDAWRPMIDDRRGHEDYEGPEGNEGSEGKVEERLVAGWRWKNNRSAGLTIELMIGLGCKQN